ncbi:MAG: LamG domain-containing protein [Pirellulales bacterium]|nr:LamG domain-containing protein [Pirellulales bacterium]
MNKVSRLILTLLLCCSAAAPCRAVGLASTASNETSIFESTVDGSTDLQALVPLTNGVTLGDYDWSGMSLQFERTDTTSGKVFAANMQDNAANTTVLAAVGANGTLTNAGNTSASSVAGPGGSYPLALSLDGVNDYINFGNAAALTPAGSFTVSIRVWSSNWAGSSYGMMLAKSGGLTGNVTYEIRLNDTTGVPQFLVSNGTTLVSVTGSGALTNSTWYTLTGVYNGSTLTLYKNGVVNGTPSGQTGAPASTTEVLALGQRRSSAPQFPFGGRATDPRVYNRALSATEVAGLHAQEARQNLPTCTLISDTFAVCANHAGHNATPIAAGDVYRFRTPAGAVVTGTVAAKTQILATDVALIQFTANPSAALARYPIVANQGAMLNRRFWAPEHNTTVNLRLASTVNATEIVHSLADAGWPGDVASSGRPCVVPLTDGRLALLGTHFGSTSFPRLDAYLAEIEAEMLAGSIETPTTVTISSPLLRILLEAR